MAKLSVELRRYFLDGATETVEDGAIANPPTPEGDVTLDEMLNLAGERTFGFLFVLLSLPSALPIPAPGYSIPFGIVMALLAVQLITGAEQPWLPKNWGKKGFERKKVCGFMEAGVPWLERIEAVSRPRLLAVCTNPLGRLFIGLAILLMSISMMIPIPLTNTLPAIGIFVTGFGLVNDDGAISLAGMTICAVSAAATSTILYLFFTLGREGMTQAVDAAKEWIKP